VAVSHAEPERPEVADEEGVVVPVAAPLPVARAEPEGHIDGEGLDVAHTLGVAPVVPVAPMEPDTEAETVLLPVLAAEAEAAAESVNVCVPEPQEEGLTETDGENTVVPVFAALGDVEGLPLAVAFALLVAPLVEGAATSGAASAELLSLVDGLGLRLALAPRATLAREQAAARSVIDGAVMRLSRPEAVSGRADEPESSEHIAGDAK
jgi:hypothetical protein